MSEVAKIHYNRTKKFDLQLSQALIDEQRLAEIFTNAKIEKVELKSESHQWEEFGNIFVEYMRDDQPSGLSVIEADMWVHELKRDGVTVLYLMFPIDRFKKLCRAAIRAGRVAKRAGDGSRQTGVLLKLTDLLS